MCCLVVGFAACDDNKDTTITSNNTQTVNGGNSNGDSSNSNANSNVSAVSVFKSGTENGHDYVDLGLTSGTKWATANVGAKTPQDYGNYYAWGEVTTKSTYNWDTYKYGTYDYDCDYSKLTKYNSTDSKTTLDLSDDAAYANWGGKWRMPTDVQWEELSNQCYWVWTSGYNGSYAKGYIVYKVKSSSDRGKKISKGDAPSSSYSLSDAHVFLPTAGFRGNGGPFDVLYGIYWSSSLDTGNPDGALNAVFYTKDVYSIGDSRCYGLSVRAVFK